MHGRLKVKTTAEQEEAKRLERLKKLAHYQHVVSKIQAKREANEMDEEALQLTAAILLKNPDFYTLWNYRKSTLDHFKDKCSAEDTDKMFTEELRFLEECLATNPKSYGSWQHRCFVMLSTPTPDWERELSLCSKFLKYDERNFHCWDYRRFVIKHANVKPVDELSFTTEKIASNFSNYSSWHHRSKLLPLIYEHFNDNKRPLDSEVLLEELELVKNAVFTDPSDQSAWFYYRWLLGRSKAPLKLLNEIHRNNTVTLTFSQPVEMCESMGVSWTSPGNHMYSYTWLSGSLPDDIKIEDVTVMYEDKKHVFLLNMLASDRKPTLSKDAVVNDEIITQELESCQELHELEPDNKWVLLMLVLLMRSLNPVLFKDAILLHLERLPLIDPLRKRYYTDMRSAFLWQQAFLSSPSTSLQLCSVGLTRLDHMQLGSLITSLNICSNELTSLYGISNMQSLVELDASNNKLRNCIGVHTMPALEKVDLTANAIGDEESIQEMKSTCPNLQTVILTGNPVDK